MSLWKNLLPQHWDQGPHAQAEQVSNSFVMETNKPIETYTEVVSIMVRASVWDSITVGSMRTLTTSSSNLDRCNSGSFGEKRRKPAALSGDEDCLRPQCASDPVGFLEGKMRSLMLSYAPILTYFVPLYFSTPFFAPISHIDGCVLTSSSTKVSTLDTHLQTRLNNLRRIESSRRACNHGIGLVGEGSSLPESVVWMSPATIPDISRIGIKEQGAQSSIAAEKHQSY